MKKIEMKNVKEIWLNLSKNGTRQRVEEVDKACFPKDYIENQQDIVDSVDRYWLDMIKFNLINGFEIVFEFVTEDDKTFYTMNYTMMINVNGKTYYGDFEDFLYEIGTAMHNQDYTEEEIAKTQEKYAEKRWDAGWNLSYEEDGNKIKIEFV